MRKSGDYEFSESMNEISGYGGCHERACRAGVRAGARWSSEHLGARPEYGFGFFTRDYQRVVAMNADAAALVRAIEIQDFIRDDGVHVPLADVLTDEMLHQILHHVEYIGSHGWNSYVAKMTAPVECFEDAAS